MHRWRILALGTLRHVSQICVSRARGVPGRGDFLTKVNYSSATLVHRCRGSRSRGKTGPRVAMWAEEQEGEVPCWIPLLPRVNEGGQERRPSLAARILHRYCFPSRTLNLVQCPRGACCRKLVEWRVCRHTHAQAHAHILTHCRRSTVQYKWKIVDYVYKTRRSNIN
ncbi:hypothetical protein E2C01_090436 [Portunus trituberculatus]|uniref:Uncharacterized protein n=1 Tax=Portunus trituberculatus TaxID=210409 RepID=A0A5B7JS81_PORTR|nr:hypothetical protein [Portunus trituberculatus]